jgi:hypothetical protein
MHFNKENGPIAGISSFTTTPMIMSPAIQN